MRSKREFGKRGEDMAVRHLAETGYKLVAANWRYGQTEVDIIAEKDDVLVFVEVKTRTGSGYGDPEESVSRSKENRLCDAAEAYLEQFDRDCEIRFDIISIVMEGGRTTLRHIEDAFFGYDS